MLGVICGGYKFLEGKEKTVITPYGKARIQKNKNVVFIARHGKGHFIPPHRINYRANIYALKKEGVRAVLGIYSSGIIKKFKEDDLIILDDFIALWTPVTFFDSFRKGIKHLDFTHPYDKRLKEILLESAKKVGITLKRGGIMATTVGPRLETKAEIRALKMLGANLVSMTHGYEAALLGEIGLPFVAVAVGTNYACGISKKPLESDEIIKKMEMTKTKLVGLVDDFRRLI